MKTKINGRFVIGYDGYKPVVFSNGCVVYENDSIIFAGIHFAGEVDRIIDAGNAIVSPGFVDLDALGDIDHAILDAYGTPETAKGLNWSEEYFASPRKIVFSADEDRLCRKYALVQLILNGVTTALPIAGEYQKEWAETYDEMACMAEIAAELGLRVYLGPSYRSGVPVTYSDGSLAVMWDEAKGVSGLHDAIRFIKDYDGAYHGLVRGFLAPARIETCTTDLLIQTRRSSELLDCPVRLHACQSDDEIRLLKRQYGKTPLELLDSIEFLGPRLLLPHATHVQGRHPSLPGQDDELHLLSENGVTVVHCPIIEARYGAVLNSFEAYRRAGINIGMGTDTFPPDMIRGMDLAHNLNKVITGSQWSLDPGEIFMAATIAGAKGLGRDDLGHLSPGAKADIIIVSLDSLRSGPVEDPIRTMLLNISGWNIKTVVINGRIVMEDGIIPGIDQQDLRQKGQNYFEKLRSAYTHRDYRRRTAEDLFPPVFRMIE